MTAIALGGALLALGACQVDMPVTSAGNAGFRASYISARTALETGRFAKAERAYADLLKRAGPLEPRVRLEYAHALLRGGKFVKASDQAQIVAAQLSGSGRAAALAVQATADQEIARQAIDRGIADADAIARLHAARAGFDEVLSKHPELDPLGGLAMRRKAVDVELSTIR